MPVRRAFAAAVVSIVLSLAGTALAQESRCTTGRWGINGGPIAVGPLMIGAVSLTGSA